MVRIFWSTCPEIINFCNQSSGFLKRQQKLEKIVTKETSKKAGIFFSNFVAFSQYPNFRKDQIFDVWTFSKHKKGEECFKFVWLS